MYASNVPQDLLNIRSVGLVSSVLSRENQRIPAECQYSHFYLDTGVSTIFLQNSFKCMCYNLHNGESVSVYDCNVNLVIEWSFGE